MVMSGETRTFDSSQRMVHHIDLSNGRPVLAAGTLYFSEDFEKLLAIDNQSGHFRPGSETSFGAVEALGKGGFDVAQARVLDFEGKLVNQTPTPKSPSGFGARLNAQRERAKPTAISKFPVARGA